MDVVDLELSGLTVVTRILMFKLYTEPFQNVCHITENVSG